MINDNLIANSGIRNNAYIRHQQTFGYILLLLFNQSNTLKVSDTCNAVVKMVE